MAGGNGLFSFPTVFLAFSVIGRRDRNGDNWLGATGTGL
jgi:hypothetical protein